jgi:1-acyl-sn-glycerol-3-phosphate acyltransferase
MSPPGRAPRVDTIGRQRFQEAGEAIPASAAERSRLSFVSCGFPLAEHDVEIVDAAGRPIGERRQGHIRFRGPSVTAGYFRNPAATRAARHDGWLDSGDLGYWADGELFITGRQKDLIKKAGRNLYPQEVEEIVGAIPGIRKGCVAAFGVPEPAIGTERLVVVAESRETDLAARQALTRAVMDGVVAALGVPPDAVVIAPPRSVLKTSSGKIRRSATRDAYLSGTLERRRSERAQWVRLLGRDVVERARGIGAVVKDALIGVYLGALLIPALSSLWLLVLLAPTAALADRLVKRWCRAILALAGCAVRLEGREHLAGAAPVVLAANHSSYLDVVVLLATLPPGTRFVAKRELLRTPLVGTVIRRARHLAVERGQRSQSVADAEQVTTALRAGQSVLVFPEGTFVESPGILPFRLGAFKAAVDTRQRVIPIAIRGTREILPGDSWLPRPGPVTVIVGAPLAAEGDGWPAMVRLRDRTRAEIARQCGEQPVDRTPVP